MYTNKYLYRDREEEERERIREAKDRMKSLTSLQVCHKYALYFYISSYPLSHTLLTLTLTP
jgi:hypothetical protein